MPDDKKICELLHDAIEDERKAKDMYHKIITTWQEYLPVEDTLAREVLIAIQKQEDTHEDMLKVMRAMKCSIK